MPSGLSNLLRLALRDEMPHLDSLTEEQASVRPAGPGSWSPKEEIGHLIDSAANNHIRFVRGALEPEMRSPRYAQDDWVRLHGYEEMEWSRIVGIWLAYNSLLVGLIARIPPEKLDTPCTVGDGPVCTLRLLIEDYILHMRHHIDHALKRDRITVYPSQSATLNTR